MITQLAKAIPQVKTASPSFYIEGWAEPPEEFEKNFDELTAYDYNPLVHYALYSGAARLVCPQQLTPKLPNICFQKPGKLVPGSPPGMPAHIVSKQDAKAFEKHAAQTIKASKLIIKAWKAQDVGKLKQIEEKLPTLWRRLFQKRYLTSDELAYRKHGQEIHHLESNVHELAQSHPLLKQLQSSKVKTIVVY